jgi:hypothetical protein
MSPAPSGRHAIVGARQPTNTSASLIDGRYVFSERLGPHDLAGEAMAPSQWHRDPKAFRSTTIRLDASQTSMGTCSVTMPLSTKSNPWCHERQYSSKPVVPNTFRSQYRRYFRPENPSQPPYRHLKDVERLCSLCATNTGEVVEEIEKAVRNSTIEYRTPPLDPGGYSMQVRDVADATSTSGVNSSFLVWPQ